MPFDSLLWLKYFETNKIKRSVHNWSGKPSIELALRDPLIRTLQRFQIGETGDGNHLRNYAKTTGDDAYMMCIDMFVKEEQEHARLLAQVIQSMEGNLLQWHWSDVAFVSLRRLLGLKTEILVLYIAEIIGKSFYRVVRDNCADSDLSELFDQIVHDELGHLEFHCQYLVTRLGGLSGAVKSIVIFGWAFLFYSACCVFIIDNKNALAKLKMPMLSFLKECSNIFIASAERMLNAYGKSFTIKSSMVKK